MKPILFFLVILITSFSYGQEFLGIKVDGNIDSVVKKFNSKGFKLKKDIEIRADKVIIEGNIGATNADITIFATPKSLKVWKFIVTLPKENSWISIILTYHKYLQILKDKYGKPSDNFEMFISPFKLGDGNEMEAIRSKNCMYSSYWIDKGVIIEISKNESVEISYENTINSNLMKKEKKEINNSIF